MYYLTMTAMLLWEGTFHPLHEGQIYIDRPCRTLQECEIQKSKMLSMFNHNYASRETKLHLKVKINEGIYIIAR